MGPLRNRSSLTETWQSAVLLSVAWKKFAPKGLRHEYDNPQFEPYSADWKGWSDLAAHADDPSLRDAIHKIGAGLHNFTEANSRRLAAEAEMKELLLAGLLSGKFLGLGFIVGKERNENHPVEIPLYMYEPKFVDWSRSTLSGANQEIISVRIALTKRVAKSVQQSAHATDEPRTASRIGRYTAREDILKTLALLDEEGQLLPSLSIKDVHNRVSRRMEHEWPDKYRKEDRDKNRKYEAVRRLYKIHLESTQNR
jgi:hypothetical protein